MAELTVDRGAVGTRLDRWLSTHLPTVSRARLQAIYRELCDCLNEGRLFLALET